MSSRATGQPLLFVAFLLALWISGRVVALWPESPLEDPFFVVGRADPSLPAVPISPPPLDEIAEIDPPYAGAEHARPAVGSSPQATPQGGRAGDRFAPQPVLAAPPITHPLPIAPDQQPIEDPTPAELDQREPVKGSGGPLSRSLRYQNRTLSRFFGGGGAAKRLAGLQASKQAPLAQSDAVTLAASHLPARIGGYAYLFWRGGEGGASALAAPAYGGNQSALILDYRLSGAEAPDRLSLYSRLSAGFRRGDGPGSGAFDQEQVAAGVRWQPDRQLPVALHGELRTGRGIDGVVPALFIAGGKEWQPAADWRIETYGQVGAVARKQPVGFGDAQARVTKRLVETDGVELSGGLGGWAAGQVDLRDGGAAGSSLYRVDAGPTLTLKLGSEEQRFRIDADYRERLSGDAEPRSGVALTLSTDF